MSLSEAEILRIQKTNPETREPAVRDDLPVTWFLRDDGGYEVISRYGDDVWQFPHSRFPAGTKESNTRIDFSTIPAAFRSALKAIFRRRDVEQRPRGSTLVSGFGRIKPFVEHLERVQLDDLARVNIMHCANYVSHCRSLTSQRGKPLSKARLQNRFVAVESLQRWAAGTPYAFPMPWPESSATHLAGLTGQGPRQPATLVIPDDILSALFRTATERLNGAENLFDVCTAVEAERARLEREGFSEGGTQHRIRALVRSKGFRNKRDFDATYAELLPAAAIVILTLSGIRIHELCYLRALPELGDKAWYATENDDGARVYWMASRSDKTGEGNTEWMVPELATQALDVATRYAQPLQTLLEKQLADAPKSAEVAAKRAHRTSLFLGRTVHKSNDVSGLSTHRIRDRIDKFAKTNGVIWHFTPHQFRRTFAVCVAKSAYGDLRYLRQHFKHWSLDMTALYALNEMQDADLYDEVMAAVIGEKVAIVTHWLDEDTLLSGGGAEAIRTFRARDEVLRAYKDRKTMATRVSDLVHIRATGSAWCTADDGGCGGRGVVEKTRCGDCVNAVIDDRHLKRWTGIYEQQLELRDIEDVGPAAKARIERDIERCEQVLRDLGAFEAVKAGVSEVEESQ